MSVKHIVLPEIISIGIYNSQLAIKNKIISQNRKTTMFEIELPIGDGGVSYVDNMSHQISDNVIICAKPGQIRHTRLPFKCYYIHMIVKEGQLFDILSSLPTYIELQNTKDFLETFISLCNYHSIGSLECDIMIQSLILKLIYMLNQYSPCHGIDHRPKRNNNEIIEETIKYINTNITSDLQLKTLCARVNFTPIYFHKLFKASTGKTLHEYVEMQRIKKSIDLLISTEMTLTQIAYDCGFSSQSYFSYAFKRHTGITPRNYAKKIIEKYDKK